MTDTKKEGDDVEFVRLADTEATTTDDDGNPRAKMEALSKGGEKDPEEDGSTNEK
ncbi:hypothetical protein [Halorubrum sp. GN11_10-6_MGM]|uniref:hypothetical protein n=1 Tax=Halorubrum sp. GN11_10-6_MGM TaxID=2518112 RepID=UPI00130E5ADA|nr:hypothetical protein [Halorubrum sp. GN11_10-6_MGM]